MIIGITGTLGSGKGTIVEYLVKKKDFKHFSVSAYLVEEILRRKMPVNRDSMTLVANDLRKKYGPGYLAESLYLRAKFSRKNCIIESLRTEGEVEVLRKKGEFYLFAVDADPRIRYERIVKRGGEKDQVSFAEFLSNEKREISSDDPTKQNLSRCIEMADFRFENNGTPKELFAKVEAVLKEIGLTKTKKH